MMATPVADGGIGRASAFLASGTVVSRILGFVKAIVLASTIGALGVSADMFAVANQLPNTIYVIVAGGVLSAVLVPQIVRASLHADGGSGYINKLVTLALVILAAATVVAVLLTAPITHLYSIGISDDKRALATAFAYWCLPQIFFYGLYTVLGEILNARRAFGPFTWAPVLNNVVAILGLVAFVILFGSDPTGHRAISSWTPGMIALLAGSATLGVVAQSTVLFLFWRRVGLRYRPDFRWRGVGLGSAGRMAGWTFGMLLLTTFAGIVETNVVILATSPEARDASVGALNNAWLIFMLPHSVIAVSIATAYFTRMAEHAAHDRLADLRTDISASIRGISLIIVLAAGVLIVCAYPFAAVFVNNDFTQTAALGTVIICYLFGLVPFCILFVVQRSFYALGDTRTPFFFTLFQTVLVSVLVLICMSLPSALITPGVALSVSIAGTAQLLLAAFLLRRRLDGIDSVRIAASLARYAAASIIPIGLGILLLVLLGGTREGGFAVSGRPQAIVSMIVIGAVMAVTYFGALWVLKAPELRTFAEPVVARLRRR
ncbi:murein biosynthesis integral membrane protein MurJ [Glaciibacter flavus]|uniref:Murein biosynthesis integral membrane protein MurJ n=1 Tax=Orlajensenia flava TaxID=2565934 RepID=A0A4V3WTZ8_9MICO|nr:murein biosynthesis integral membrane protein MurJ [Glaciibacter flavus]